MLKYQITNAIINTRLFELYFLEVSIFRLVKMVLDKISHAGVLSTPSYPKAANNQINSKHSSMRRQVKPPNEHRQRERERVN